MQTIPDRTFAAVLGSPIEHSLSPILHSAAYQVLGLNWAYEKYDVTEETFVETLAALPSRCVGLSLTMPLKDVAFEVADSHDEAAQLTGACNTLVRDGQSWHGFNTDVPGFINALTRASVSTVDEALVLGAGATARSAVAAMQLMGAGRVHIAARRLDAVDEIRRMFPDLAVVAHSLDDLGNSSTLVINTLPGSVADSIVLPQSCTALFDVIYAPWPTALALKADERKVLGGLDLLVAQAVEQVLLMTNVGSDRREELYEAMYAAGLVEQVKRSQH